MYKRQADPISFPGPDRRYQFSSPSFFSIKNLIWPQDPLNKGKIDFYCIFELPEAFTTRIQKKSCKNPPKKQRTQLQVLIFFPKKQKSYYYSPPPPPPPPFVETCLIYMGGIFFEGATYPYHPNL